MVGEGGGQQTAHLLARTATPRRSPVDPMGNMIIRDHKNHDCCAKDVIVSDFVSTKLKCACLKRLAPQLNATPNLTTLWHLGKKMLMPQFTGDTAAPCSTFICSKRMPHLRVCHILSLILGSWYQEKVSNGVTLLAYVEGHGIVARLGRDGQHQHLATRWTPGALARCRS